MKRFSKYFLGLFIFIYMMSLISPQVKAETVTNENLAYLNKNYKEYASNSEMVFYVNEKNAEFCIYNKKLNDYWWSNPPERSGDPTYKAGVKMRLDSLFTFRYIRGVTFTPQTINSSLIQNNPIDEKGKSKISIKKISNGVRYDFRLYDGTLFTGITLPIEIVLKEGYFEVRIPVKDVIEEEVTVKEDVKYAQDGSKVSTQTKAKVQLLDVNLFPFFNSATKDQNGYLFVPDGCGAIINNKFNLRGYKQYMQNIYGPDPILFDKSLNNYRQDVYMPVFGNKVDDKGYFAIVDGDSANTKITADTAGVQNGSYMSLEPGFSFRAFDSVLRSRAGAVPYNIISDKIIQTDPVVRYYMLKGNSANYNGMADIYRNYLIKEKGLKKETDKHNPLFLNIVNGAVMEKNILGFKFDIYEPLTTFGESKEIVDNFKKNGINEMSVELTGWTKDGIATGFIDNSKPLGKLGGTKGINELNNYLSQNKIPLYPGVDLLNVKELGNGFSFRNDALRMINKTFSKDYQYNLATGNTIPDSSWFLLSPSKIEKAYGIFEKSYDKMNIKGLSLQTLGSQLQSNNSVKDFVYRSNAISLYAKELELLKNKYNHLLIHDAKSYSFPYAEAITKIPLDCTPYEIIDYSVPFYAMVLHGIVPYAGDAINLMSNTKKYFLRSLESGAGLNYTLMYEKNTKLKDTPYQYLYSTNYEDWKDDITARYKEINKIYNEIYNAQIVSHERISEDLVSVTYGNNVKIIINYSSSTKSVGSYQVGPESYIVLKGGERL